MSNSNKKTNGTLFAVAQYADYIDINKAIEALDDKCWEYAVGKHDKDGDKLHYHIVIRTPTPTTLESIANVCGVEKQYVEWGKTSLKYCCGYLTHANDPSKVQYTYEEAVIADKCNARKYIDVVREEAQLSIKPLLDRIDKGEIYRYNITKYVNHLQYVKYHKQIEMEFKYQDLAHAEDIRNMEVIFITGKAGTGKTSLARIYSEMKGYHAYVTSNGKNPFDDYAGQEAVILDDCRPSDFKFNDFLKLLDNNTASLVGCRYYNKSLYRCRCIIITSTLPLEEWYHNLTDSDNEALEQLTRRVGTIVTITSFDRQTGTIKFTDNCRRDLEYIASIANYQPPVKKSPFEDLFEHVKRKILVEDNTQEEIPF